MTTKPARSKCSTRRLATISAMISSALWTRLRPWKRSAIGQRVGEVGRIRGGKLLSVHQGRIAERSERNKNTASSSANVRSGVLREPLLRSVFPSLWNHRRGSDDPTRC